MKKGQETVHEEQEWKREKMLLIRQQYIHRGRKIQDHCVKTVQHREGFGTWGQIYALHS
jgi:hypothetical protein